MRRTLPVVLWGALLVLPWWLPAIGGYTALGSKVLIYGIATMGLNLLLGFTGGLSFGQAAYFGLGAYGAGMTLKYIAASTPLAIVVGTLVGGIAATLLGPLVMRRRGIYFAMITIVIGQLFYFVAGSLERGDGRRGRVGRVRPPGHPHWQLGDRVNGDQLLLSGTALFYPGRGGYVDHATFTSRPHLGGGA